nr:hypothetical protein [Pandoravirus massiliensis]
MDAQRRFRRCNENKGAWRRAIATVLTGLFCLGLLLVAAQPPRPRMCRVVAREVIAEKADTNGHRLYLVAVALADSSTSDSHSENNNDGDDDMEEPPARVSALWADAAERDALWRQHRPGTKVACFDGGRALSTFAAPGASRAGRSDAGDGPRIAALCAAAVALALVLVCGAVACACKTRWCAEHCWPRRAGHAHGSSWGDNDARHGYRLVDSVFG